MEIDTSLIESEASAFPMTKFETVSAGRTVFQYWNDQPDEQVAALLGNTEDVCVQHGFSYALFGEADARQFLLDNFDHRSAHAFDRCLHQAQRSDLFRYHYLFVEGGLWIDADITLKANPVPVSFAAYPCLNYRKTFLGRISNRIMSAPPRSEFFRTLIERCVNNILDDEVFQSCQENRDILTLSGPRVVNEVFQALCVRRGHVEAHQKEPVALLFDDGVLDSIFISGSEFLNAPLRYKSTNRSWQEWSAEAPNSPISEYRRKRREQSDTKGGGD